MKRVLLLAFALGAVAIPVTAQSPDDLNIQIHGYATQGFLYTNHNNMFYANTSDGSPAWTEAVMNVSAQPTSALRFGIQARYQMLGSSGNAITLDWAAADYKFSDDLGLRFGKVKTPWGLFNETQDIDPSYVWALLPQSVYDITTRDSDLSHYGGVAYGSVGLGSKSGTLDYRLWGGEQVIPKTDGQFDDLNASGNGPLEALSFVTIGGAIHWRTPLRGLMLGSSDGKNNGATVALNGGSERFAPWNNLSYFAQYEQKKVMIAGEWNRQASAATLGLEGKPSTTDNSDARGWFVMATYKLTGKLSAGAYNSQFFDCQAALGTDRFAKDWTISGRYDVNDVIYIKADEHFVDGSALSLSNVNNTTIVPKYRLTVFKVGVSF